MNATSVGPVDVPHFSQRFFMLSMLAPPDGMASAATAPGDLGRRARPRRTDPREACGSAPTNTKGTLTASIRIRQIVATRIGKRWVRAQRLFVDASRASAKMSRTSKNAAEGAHN